MSALQKLLEDPVRFARLKRWFYVGVAGVLVAEVAFSFAFPGHPHFAFESFPGWGSIYGFVSCVAIIVVSKLIGKLVLMRREDHYE